MPFTIRHSEYISRKCGRGLRSEISSLSARETSTIPTHHQSEPAFIIEVPCHGYRQITSRLRVRLRYPDISPCDDAMDRRKPPRKSTELMPPVGREHTVHARREEREMDRAADVSHAACMGVTGNMSRIEGGTGGVGSVEYTHESAQESARLAEFNRNRWPVCDRNGWRS